MNESKYYEVVVLQRIPYLTTFLFWLFIFLIFCLGLVFLHYLPSRFYIQDTPSAHPLPKVVLKIILFSISGFLFSGVIYFSARLHTKAVLAFRENDISIIGEKLNIPIKINYLEKITFMDNSKEIGKRLKEKFTVLFKRKGDKSIRIRFVHYAQSEEFIDQFLPYPNIKYEFLNFDYNGNLENEI